MADPDPNDGFAHLVRAAIAILLALMLLPVVLFADTTDISGGTTDIVQVYLDALAAVVAFYFGASSNPG